MIEEQGTVIAVDNETITVEINRSSGCSGCQASSGCGTSILDRVFRRSKVQTTVTNKLKPTTNIQVNDRVIIGLQEGGMIRAALLLYIVPIITMIVLAIIAEFFMTSAIVVIAVGGLGMFLGLWLVRQYIEHKKNDSCYQATLLKVVHLIN